jgi:non-specific protein-tyrosine kinase
MQALRRHLGLIAAITLLAAGATAVFAALRPASFRSHADLLVATGFLSGAYGPQVKPPFQTQAQVLVTQAKLASEPAVADEASRLLHGRFSPAQIRSAVTVSASPNLDIMTVSATAESPTDARQIANAYSVSVARRARSQARHEILTAAATVAAALAVHPSPARTQQLLAQQRKLELLAAGTDGGVQVTQPAVSAVDANLPAYQLVLLGAITGLVLGVLAALAVDRFEYRVDEREIAERLDCRTLGRITAGDDVNAARSVALALDDVAASALARVIVVVGAGDRQPSAAAASRIAIGLAETGRRVILIDANLRHPTLHEAFVVAPTPGLAEVIGDEVYDVGSALQPIRLAAGANGTLQLLATGNAGGSDPALMLASTSFRDALDVIEPLADYTVLAAADMNSGADARLTARRAHGIVVAVTDPGTRPRELDQVLAGLETGRAPVLGAVLVEAGVPILTQP